MNELKPIFDLLSARFGWFSAVTVCLPALLWFFGAVVKPFNLRLQAVLTERMADAIEDEEDAARYHRILNSTWYWFGSLLLDIVMRIKLPTNAAFHKLLNERCQAAPQSKPTSPVS